MLLTKEKPVDTDVPIVSLEPPRRRRTSLIVLGGLVVVVAALVAAWLVASAGETHRVLVARDDLNAGQVITDGDLQVVELGGSADFPTMSADNQSAVLGRVAAAAIPAGTVLNPAMFITAEDVLPDGKTIVGAVLEPGQFPSPDVKPGITVSMIATSEDDSGTSAERLGEGVIYRLDTAADGRYWVSLLVDDDLGLAVSSAAATGDLRLGVVP